MCIKEMNDNLLIWRKKTVFLHVKISNLKKVGNQISIKLEWLFNEI